MANIVQTFPRGNSGGSGSGHTILNTDGTAVAQESKMQFKGLSVTDNSSDGKTEVAGIGLNQDSINDIAESLDSAPAIVIGDANNYSTTERLVGKWINGKPLYQKTLVYNNSWSGATAITIGTLPSDAEEAFIVSGYFINTYTNFGPNGTYFMLNSTGRNVEDTKYDTYSYYNPSNKTVVLLTVTNTAGSKILATL